MSNEAGHAGVSDKEPGLRVLRKAIAPHFQSLTENHGRGQRIQLMSDKIGGVTDRLLLVDG